MTADFLYSSRRWLAFCAEMSSMPSGAVTAALSDGGLAALPVALAGGVANPFYDWTAILTARGLPAPPPIGLLAGPGHGYQTHLLTTPGADRREAAERLRAAFDEAGLPAMAMFLGTPDVAVLRQAGVRALPMLLQADAWLRVPAGGWEEWLGSLSRGRRYTVRSEIRRFAEAGYEIVEGRCASGPAWPPSCSRPPRRSTGTPIPPGSTSDCSPPRPSTWARRPGSPCVFRRGNGRSGTSQCR